MEDVDSLSEKKPKSDNASEGSAEGCKKDASQPNLPSVSKQRQKVCDFRKNDSRKSALLSTKNRKKEKEPISSASATCVSDIIIDKSVSSEGSHSKPSRKPPLSRSKGSGENLEIDSAVLPRLTRQASQEEPLPLETGRRKSSNGRNKVLLRGQPVLDDSSPPPTPDIAIHIQQPEQSSVCRFPHQHSGDAPSLTPFIKQSSLEARSEPALSREPSQEKEFTDSKGVNLQQFIVDTLRKPQDRTMLLQLEKEFTDLVHSSLPEKKFAPMSSYHRMIVHRVAAYFGLDHNVDQTGKAVIVNKTANTRIPEKKFKDHIHEDQLDGPARRILKRDTASYDDKYDYEQSDKSDMYSKDDKKSKSFEERQEQYDRARARIFNQSPSTQEALTVDSPTRPKAILQLNSRQSSGASDDSSYQWKQDRPWSSVDSSGSEKPHVPVITKASSFAGSSISNNILMRDDSGGSSRSSVTSSSSNSKIQTQDPLDGCSANTLSTQSHHYYSKVSASVGYNQTGQPQTVESSVCQQGSTVTWSNSIPSPVPPNQFSMAPLLPGSQGTLPAQQPVLFIAPNIESVPPGCIIVNPQSGQPFLNKDGSPMVYQPLTTLQQRQQSLAQQTHLSTQAVNQQQIVAQSSQHSNLQPLSQYSQPIADSQLCAPHMVPFIPQQGQQSLPMVVQNAADYQDLHSQFVNLALVNQDAEGAMQLPQVGSQPQQPSTQQISQGMMTMKGPASSSSSHDLSQQYPAMQQSQQISCNYGSHLPLPDSVQQYHQGSGSQSSSLRQLCQPTVQSHVSSSNPTQQIFLSQPGESQLNNNQSKSQAMYSQGYSTTGVPTSHSPQIIYISEPQQPVDQSVPVFISTSQSQLTSGQIVSSTRDAIRPASPNAQTIPGTYSLPPQQHVLNQNFPMVQIQRSLSGSHIPSGTHIPSVPSGGTHIPSGTHVPSGGTHIPSGTHVPSGGTHIPSGTHIGPPRTGTNFQVVTTALPGTIAPGSSGRGPQNSFLHGTNLPSQLPPPNPPGGKELWRISPATVVPHSYRQQFASEKANEEAQVLEVCQLPRDLTCQAVLPLLEDITQFGAKIYWIPKTEYQSSHFSGNSQVPSSNLVSEFTVLARFPNPEQAQKAVFNSANAAYSLQQPSQNYVSFLLGDAP